MNKQIQTTEPAPITKTEHKRLVKLVDTSLTEASLKAADAGRALLTIFRGGHWQTDGKTWEAYCLETWPHHHRSTMWRKLAQAQFEEETPGLIGIPQSHAKVLEVLPPEARVEVYEAAGADPKKGDVETAAAEYIEAHPEAVNADTATGNAGPGPILGGLGGGGGGMSAAATDKDEEKRGIAIQRLGDLFGSKLRKALKDGILMLKTKELCFWAGLNDENARSIHDLVTVDRWQPVRAFAFVNKMPVDTDKFSMFQNRANLEQDKGYYECTIDGCLGVFVTRDDLREKLVVWCEKNLKPLAK